MSVPSEHKPHLVHLVRAGQPLGRTACGLTTELPERPWREGLVADAQWMGPLGEITCPECIETLQYPDTAEQGVYAR